MRVVRDHEAIRVDTDVRIFDVSIERFTSRRWGQ
jgi:hypothetical protein